MLNDIFMGLAPPSPRLLPPQSVKPIPTINSHRLQTEALLFTKDDDNDDDDDGHYYAAYDTCYGVALTSHGSYSIYRPALCSMLARLRAEKLQLQRVIVR